MKGAAAILNAAQHLLRPGGIMIPHRSLSQIAAVALPMRCGTPRFSDLARFYVGGIFEKAGYPFDPRLCIKGLARDSLVSSADVFEDLDFSSVVPLSDEHEIHLAIERTGCIDGFLVWLNLTLGTGVTIDILDGGYSSLPVYLPVFDRGVTVAPGDVIHAKVQRQVSEDGLHPDFFVQGDSFARMAATWPSHTRRITTTAATAPRLFSSPAASERGSAEVGPLASRPAQSRVLSVRRDPHKTCGRSSNRGCPTT